MGLQTAPIFTLGEIDMDNKSIMVGLITVGVIAVILAIFFSSMAVGQTYVECFEVTDPSADQVLTLQHTPDQSRITVEQYNGFSWETISSSDYSTSLNVVTVDSSALYGG